MAFIYVGVSCDERAGAVADDGPGGVGRLGVRAIEGLGGGHACVWRRGSHWVCGYAYGRRRPDSEVVGIARGGEGGPGCAYWPEFLADDGRDCSPAHSAPISVCLYEGCFRGRRW